jgi:DNA (cytosine-5)-methyltransferase 1
MRTLETLELFPSRPTISLGGRSCISLCSGILGLELGLWRAGFGIKLAIDTDESAKRTVALNFPEMDYLVKNVSRTSATLILSQTGANKGKMDLLAGGLPCQSFSKSGLRKGLKDGRGKLFKHYIRLLTGLEPKAFIVENVRGIISTQKGKDFKKIIEEFNKTGYRIYWKVLNAANYGVPQFRQRLFIVGFRERIRFLFPESTHEDPDENSNGLKPFVTVKDAIGSLRNVKDHPRYRGKYAHLLRGIPEGLNYSYYTKERGHPNPVFDWRSKFWFFLLKIDRRRPSLTIQANPGNNTGPFHWKNRKLGICELKRLQTIPDWFEMEGSYMTKHRHIGNAVPPLLAYKIGVQIDEALNKEEHISEQEYHAIIEKMNQRSATFQICFPEECTVRNSSVSRKRAA